MKDMQKHKKILLIVSILIVLLLFLCIWWLGKSNVKKNEDKTPSDQVIIEHEKESEDGLNVEGAEEADKEENTTPFIDSPTNSTGDDKEQSNKEQDNESGSTIKDTDVENDESTDNTENDADVGLEQNATEQTNGKHGDFF